MPQIFSPRSNTIARAGIVSVLLFVPLVALTWHEFYRSPFRTRVNVPVEQPIPFSHKHHVGGLGIDCRYCHTSVERSAFAGIPSTEICMTCHSQLWTDAPLLEPARQSLASRRPLTWNRVNDLPDYVFFNHSIHIAKGIGCSSCHGRVDQMPLIWKTSTLFMKWCLDCHNDPGRFVRPQAAIFDTAWNPPDARSGEADPLISDYKIRTEQLRDCSICHR